MPLLEPALHDLRYGLRMLAKNPGFTAVAVLSLALGIGANTGIFTLIDAVLFRMLPVQNPRELVLFQWSAPIDHPIGSHWMNGNVWDENGRSYGTPFSYPAFEHVRAHNEVLSEATAFISIGSVNVVADGAAALASGQMVSGNFFSLLGIQPVVGRMFTASDDRLGAAPVCVISDGYWKRRFGGDRNIAGKTISLDGVLFTIVGVTPADFFGLQPGRSVEISVPLAAQPLVEPRWDPKVSLFTASDHWWVLIVGRLKPAVSAQQATANLDALFKQAVTLDADSRPGRTPAMPSLELMPASHGLDQLRRQFSRPLFILMSVVALVLLIACANVANLLLARATARQKEIGVRLSLGASRLRLVRQLLTESALLACFGGVLGVLLAYWGSSLLVTFLSPAGRPLLLDVHPDWLTLGFTALVCIVTALLFGLAPAWRATRVDLTPSLKQASQRVGGGRLRLDFSKTLVIAQTALSMVLLFGAGLFVRTLVNLKTLDAGFDKENLLLFGINAAQAGYKGRALSEFYDRVQHSVAALPGVTSATSSLHLLLSGSTRSNDIWVPGYTPKAGEKMIVRVLPAGSGFFTTMKMTLLRGRDFNERDNEVAPKVAVVNETFVKLYFAGRDPVGQRIGRNPGQADTEIVGVARDAKYNSLRRETAATVYMPFRQSDNLPLMHYELRTSVSPQSLIPAVRNLVRSLDRNIPLFDVKTQTEQVDELLLQERLFAKLSSFFGLLALVLACVGLYGITSYAVVRRTAEIGIRMALGAQRWNVLRMVLSQAMFLAALGVLLGVPAALLTTRYTQKFIADLLYGLKATDVTTIAIAAAILIAMAVIAGFVPARRASRVDPIRALRYE